jgi:hypothetical protein
MMFCVHRCCHQQQRNDGHGQGSTCNERVSISFLELLWCLLHGGFVFWIPPENLCKHSPHGYCLVCYKLLNVNWYVCCWSQTLVNSFWYVFQLFVLPLFLHDFSCTNRESLPLPPVWVSCLSCAVCAKWRLRKVVRGFGYWFTLLFSNCCFHSHWNVRVCAAQTSTHSIALDTNCNSMCCLLADHSGL